MADNTEEEMLRALNAAMASIARSNEPYWAAIDLEGVASSLMTEFGVAYRLYLMWAALTDLYELEADERQQTAVLMRRAANEWSHISTDAAGREAYLERWLFDELGLSRSIGREF